MEQISSFVKGLVTDVDETMVQSGQWSWPTLNARMSFVKGKGYVMSTMDGTSELFTLASGYEFLDAVEHAGILYIVSSNGAFCEIGTYPKMNYPSPTLSQLYGPLMNIYDGTNRLPFNVQGLGFSNSSRLSVIARDDYDGTVNLYIIDGEHPNVVVNSGFSKSQGYISRTYSPGQIPNHLRQFLTTTSNPSVNYHNIIEYGSLEFGNYFIYLRYLDSSYNRTKFMTSFGPFQIGKGYNAVDLEGGALAQPSGKALELEFTGLDTTYPFFEIGVAVSSGDNNSHTDTAWLVSNKFSIGSTTQRILITGNEDRSVLAVEDLLRYSEGTASLAQDVGANRWWSANWKSTSVNKDVFAEFAKRIKIGYTTDHLSGDDMMVDNRLINGLIKSYAVGGLSTEMSAGLTTNKDSKGQYKSYPESLSYGGYFRGEAYAFMCVAEMDDGSYSDSFPMCGFDNYNTQSTNPGIGVSVDNDGYWLDSGGTKIGSNAKGVYRFPFYNNTIYFEDTQVCDQGRVLGVKFTMTDALAYMNANIGLFSNVKRIFFTRTERFENLLYQGMRAPVWKYMNSDSLEKLMPFLDGKIPITLKAQQNGGGSVNTDDTYHGAIICQSTGANYLKCEGCDATASALSNTFADLHMQTEYAAVFAMDHMFESSPASWKYYDCYELAIDTPSSYETFSKGTQHLHTDPYHQTYPLHITTNVFQIVDQWKKCDIESVEDYNATTSSYGFSSFAEHGLMDYDYFMKKAIHSVVQDSGGPFNATVVNRTLHTGRYIGVKYHAGRTTAELFTEKLVSLYRTKNDVSYFDTVVKTFGVPFARTTRISSFKVLPLATASYEEYHGDCFMQRGWRRTMHWHSKQPTDTYMFDSNGGGVEETWSPSISWVPATPFRYEHGHSISFISECSRNIAMRYSDENRTHYPRCLLQGATDLFEFTVSGEDDIFIDEANYYNAGYHVTTPQMIHFGVDMNIIDELLRKPTRVMASHPHIAGQVTDPWRVIGLQAHQDYYVESGAINGLFIMGSSLMLVHERAIKQVPIDFQGAELPSNSGMTVIGSNTLLGPIASEVSSFGGQHVYAIVKTDYGVFGYDALKNVLWATGMNVDGYRQNIQALDIGEKTANKKLMQTMSDYLGLDASAFTELRDDIRNGVGFTMGYDRKNKELILVGKNLNGEGEDRNLNFGIVYNMGMQAMFGGVEMEPARMVKFGDLLVSATDGSESVHSHNTGSPLTFHGTKRNWKFSIVVNGNTGQENYAAMEKLFNSWRANMPENQLFKAYYETDYQEGVQDLSLLAPFYSAPIHSEGAWNVPIDDQTSLLDHEMDTESRMRGRWLRITVEYDGNEFNFVRNVITSFMLSKR